MTCSAIGMTLQLKSPIQNILTTMDEDFLFAEPNIMVLEMMNDLPASIIGKLLNDGFFLIKLTSHGLLGHICRHISICMNSLREKSQFAVKTKS